MNSSVETANYAHSSPVFSAIVTAVLALVLLVLVIGAAIAIRTVFHAYKAAVQYLQGRHADAVESLMRITAMYARLNKIIGRERTAIEDEQFTYSSAIYIAHDAALHEQEGTVAEKAVNAYPDNAFFQHVLIYALMSQEKWQQASAALKAYTESYDNSNLSIQVQQYIGEFEQAITTKTAPTTIEAMLYGESAAKALASFRRRAQFLRVYAPIAAIVASLLLLGCISIPIFFPDI